MTETEPPRLMAVRIDSGVPPEDVAALLRERWQDVPDTREAIRVLRDHHDAYAAEVMRLLEDRARHWFVLETPGAAPVREVGRGGSFRHILNEELQSRPRWQLVFVTEAMMPALGIQGILDPVVEAQATLTGGGGTRIEPVTVWRQAGDRWESASVAGPV